MKRNCELIDLCGGGNYETPSITVVDVCGEGPLCASGYGTIKDWETDGESLDF